ncbi:MAG: exodeoxyribonuclease VII small subunit [Deltaproteobacteria bacterium]|nr:exodeoxyribonuclease VII small subunit [Deltaproteobacteria bacterium]
MAAKTNQKETKEVNDLSFEEILSRLDRMVKELEKGDTPLEKSLSTFEEGVRLSRLGARRLDEAERRIELLLSNENGVETRPLDKEPDAQ